MADLQGNAQQVHGTRAQDAATADNPVVTGGETESYGTTPALADNGDVNRFKTDFQGLQFVIGGAPNVITREIAHGTGAAADENMAAAVVAANEVCVVTRAWAIADEDNTANIQVRMGFGATVVPTASASGVSGMIMSHPGIPAGSGFSVGDGGGIVAVGAAGEEPRIDTEAASTNLFTGISYYIVDQT